MLRRVRGHRPRRSDLPEGQGDIPSRLWRLEGRDQGLDGSWISEPPEGSGRELLQHRVVVIEQVDERLDRR